MKKNNNCKDCNKPIWKKNIRCKSCDNRNKKGTNTGKLSGMWEGNKVGLRALHTWIRKNKPKPEPFICEECKVKPATEVANISKQYKRDINDFRWLCHRCNLIEDGVIIKLREGYNRNKESIMIKLNEGYKKWREKESSF